MNEDNFSEILRLEFYLNNEFRELFSQEINNREYEDINVIYGQKEGVIYNIRKKFCHFNLDLG